MSAGSNAGARGSGKALATNAAGTKRGLGAKARSSSGFRSRCIEGDCSKLAVVQSLCAWHRPHYNCSHVGVDNEQCNGSASIKSLLRKKCLCESHFNAYLLKKRRDANWKRRSPFLNALVGSKLRETAAVMAARRIVQATSDKSAKLAPVPRKTPSQNLEYLHGAVFAHEAFVRIIAAYL